MRAIKAVTNGWDESASAWIADMGKEGDFGRRYVLDAPMIERIGNGSFRSALDVGCGEGRFCRMLRTRGIKPVGIDPTEALIQHARKEDPDGDYRIGRAEALEFPDASFDLVVSYLSLIDIPDIKTGISEMARVLKPGGTLLIANLTSFNTAGQTTGWVKDTDGIERFFIDHYMEERAEWVRWTGIRVQNWHRPLSTYMSLLLKEGLELRHFSEPMPGPSADPLRSEFHRRVPYFLMMEWQKPLAGGSGRGDGQRLTT
jgi:ubiquinone/menaquinone biosynthesis C-methylase UbiE